MLVTISKEFRFEMEHRLPYHTGGCQNIHGHSYRLVVTVTGEPDDQGMVMDFGDISAQVKPIVAVLDHSFMVDDSDREVIEFLKQKGLKTTQVPFFSTAENIAAWLLGRIADTLAPNPHLTHLQVTVHETVTSTATVQTPLPKP